MPRLLQWNSPGGVSQERGRNYLIQQSPEEGGGARTALLRHDSPDGRTRTALLGHDSPDGRTARTEIIKKVSLEKAGGPL